MKERTKNLFKYFYYKSKKLIIFFRKQIFRKTDNNIYVFILSPPFTGSTMLVDIISTSKNVSLNNHLGTKEGQTLPEVKKIMFDNPNRWNEGVDFDWTFIKKVWIKYWDTNKLVLLEKSPANILRAKSISSIFKPSKFIISCRNPYAQCESIINRNNSTPEYAANFAISCLRHQKKNIEYFENNSLFIPYEEITENIDRFKQKMINFLPEIKDMSVSHKVKAHNQSGKPINLRNLNNDKIKKISKNDLEIINSIFMEHKKLLNYFNYNIIEH